jgi:hypothetical protein
MSQKSEDRRIVRKGPGDIRPSTRAELARIAARKDEAVDTSDIPERTGPANRVHRDSRGRISAPPKSRIREAILSEIERRRLSGHQLWIEARKRCGTIPESAVYEFLSGKRQVGLAYLDAMLEALDLTVSRSS